ncbi:hypothetical protein P170DRAFT_177197 [Aspergillus steynii IBT 23096]|uniref:RBR-type E3 ubiquitin transferase n=1 Tax=Aspergillus steynii IBT 23096 TaxID=1392250 RepID=A0A2I2G8I6_9EURO|nr:uncharacterized protein P170DRAFT_177197 [Aspergillus steynii IBT 23096]PLB49184.1 hypothetical protein P170DRAFT_177197 [Aspergillus steynii IBT 23096]
MNAPYPDEISYTTHTRDISPPPRYSLHEPLRPPQPNDRLTSTEQPGTLSAEDSTRHLTTSHIILDGESTSCWSDAFTASAVLSLLQRESLTPLPRPVTHNDINLREIPLLTCVVCFETFSDDYFPRTPITASCDHGSMPDTNICLACLRRSLDIQFSSPDTSSLACPLCHEQLSDEEVHRWASRQTFQTYDRMRTWQILEEDAEFVPCIQQNCGYGQLHAGGLEDPIVVCRSCGSRTCFIHRETPWHEGMTCTDYEEKINPRESELDIRELAQNEVPELSNTRRSSNDTQASSSSELTRPEAIEWVTRPCPHCSSPTARPSGCKFTRCESCLHEWCWDCGISWKWRHLDMDCILPPQ